MSTPTKTPLKTAVALVSQLPQPAITVPARCELVGPTEVLVRTGDHEVSVDEPQVFGGGGTAPTPGRT